MDTKTRCGWRRPNQPLLSVGFLCATANADAQAGGPAFVRERAFVRRITIRTTRTPWPLVSAVTLLLALASPMARQARADQNFFYALPMVDARAVAENGGVEEFDALLDGQLGDVLPRNAHANSGGGFAQGEASDNQFVATAASSGFGAAITRAYMEFVVHDPQSRGLVKVDVSSKLSSIQGRGFKGAVSVGRPPTKLTQADAGVAVRVAPAASPFMISFTDDGKIASLEFPVPASNDGDLFAASAHAECGYDEKQAPKCRWGRSVSVNNRPIDGGEGDGGSVTLDAAPTFSVAPGLHYVIAIEAHSNFAAAAVIDPVLEPNPDNPDISIELPNVVADANPPPFMAGITPEALQAQGIDPQPFLDFGFLSPSPPPVEATCTNGASIAKPALSMRTADHGAETKLHFQGLLPLEPLPLDPAFDPVAHGARVVVVDASGKALLDETVPGGAFDGTTKTGWRHALRSKQWVYARPSSRGIHRVVLKSVARTSNLVQFVVDADLGSTRLPTQAQLPLEGTLVIDAPVARNGQCGAAELGGAPPATPCKLPRGKRIVCK